MLVLRKIMFNIVVFIIIISDNIILAQLIIYKLFMGLNWTKL